MLIWNTLGFRRMGFTWRGFIIKINLWNKELNIQILISRKSITKSLIFAKLAVFFWRWRYNEYRKMRKLEQRKGEIPCSIPFIASSELKIIPQKKTCFGISHYWQTNIPHQVHSILMTRLKFHSHSAIKRTPFLHWLVIQQPHMAGILLMKNSKSK